MMNEVAELHAARRYLTNVLLKLDSIFDIDTEHISALTFINLIEHLAENPSEYYELLYNKRDQSP